MDKFITKPALSASDHLSQTVAALARLLDQTMNDIKVLESECHEQISLAVKHTEASLEQENAERLKLAIEEAQQNTRAVVSLELQEHFSQQMAAAVETARNELIADRQQELERLRQAASEWEAERARLVADCERANGLLEQSRQEHERALAEVDEAAAIALERQIATAVDHGRAELRAQWDAERTKLIGERNRAQQRLVDVASEYDELNTLRSELASELDRLRHELEQAKHAAAVPAPVTAPQVPPENQAVEAEVVRVEELIHAIGQVVENPDTELSVVIRKNVERAELESYLRGLRFRVVQFRLTSKGESSQRFTARV